MSYRLNPEIPRLPVIPTEGNAVARTERILNAITVATANQRTDGNVVMLGQGSVLQKTKKIPKKSKKPCKMACLIIRVVLKYYS